MFGTTPRPVPRFISRIVLLNYESAYVSIKVLNYQLVINTCNYISYLTIRSENRTWPLPLLSQLGVVQQNVICRKSSKYISVLKTHFVQKKLWNETLNSTQQGTWVWRWQANNSNISAFSSHVEVKGGSWLDDDGLVATHDLRYVHIENCLVTNQPWQINQYNEDWGLFFYS